MDTSQAGEQTLNRVQVTTSTSSTSGTVSSTAQSYHITGDLIPLVQATNETLERSRLIVNQEPTDNDEDLMDPIGEGYDLVDATEDLKRTVRSQEFYLRYGDHMGRVWKCLELASRRVPQASEKLAGVLQHLEEREIRISSDVAKAAIMGYAIRNEICHGGPGKLDDKRTRDAIASNVDDLEKFLPDDQRADRDLWVRIVKLWKKCGRYVEEVRTSAPETTPTPDSSSLLAAPPRTAEQKEKFTRALEEGSFQGELDQLSRGGGPCRQDSPHRTQSTRSDPFHGVPSKRKTDLTPAPSSLRPLKRQK
ncbi:hypothetical protein N7519_007460 [Penicillium mononematosum]|uniref:uncharacterized protein n=1 Tax=Penicillium mononematosum TaxID=268346 RepID=UPI0025499ED5|nr:uncharacterized protein N7519_007460 [Penicillium mononematosum]KAJ6186159.1 hypothetical protein N7519_007460 [Penicillium mononematosum]